MRVSLFFVIPLSLATTALAWWQGVKGKDFLTPPPSAILAVQQRSLHQERAKELSDLEKTAVAEPTTAVLVKPILMPSIDPTLAIEEPKKAEEIIEVGDTTKSPGLDAYAQFSEKGSSYFIQLATLLETSGEIHRSLLAWERVYDFSSPDEEQRQLATAAITRLRPQVPAWIIDPTARTGVTIHVGCGAQTATQLTPILKEIVEFLSEKSSGIIRFSSEISVGKSASALSPPIALWFSSHVNPSQISRTIIMPSSAADSAQMRNSLLRSLYKIFRDEIGTQNSYKQPIALIPSTSDPSAFFQTYVTRLHWLEFSKRLSKTP